MQYGDMSHRKEFHLTYMGADPANDSYTSMEDISSPSISRVVSQRDADLLHLHHKVSSIILFWILNSRNIAGQA